MWCVCTPRDSSAPACCPPLLDIAGFDLARGEKLFLRGPSGSGKSTLLGLVAGVLEPQSGTIEVLGENMTGLAGSKRDRLRADRMGVIFQMFNLVPYLSVVQNVMLPCRFSGLTTRVLLSRISSASSGVSASVI